MALDFYPLHSYSEIEPHSKPQLEGILKPAAMLLLSLFAFSVYASGFESEEEIAIKESKKMEMKLPPLLVALMEQGRWPNRVISSSMQRMFPVFQHPYLDEVSIEFYTSAQTILDNNHWQLQGFFDDIDKPRPDNVAYYRVKRGSNQIESVKLPWLDVEKVIFIGQPLLSGDDVWIFLDYRTDADDPRVIVNVAQSDPDTPRAHFWRELAPSFSEFAEMVLAVAGDQEG
jgi:hypothetical protein